MYLGRRMPLFFLLFGNLHSSKTISEDKTILPFLSLPTLTGPGDAGLTKVLSVTNFSQIRYLSRVSEHQFALSVPTVVRTPGGRIYCTEGSHTPCSKPLSSLVCLRKVLLRPRREDQREGVEG